MSLVHEKLKQKLAGSRAGFGWRPKNGDNRIFILPPGSQWLTNLDSVETLAFPFKAHFFQVEGKNGEASRCLQDLGQKCPACAMYRLYANSSDPGLKELAKQIKPADQYIFNIVDLSDPAKGVQRWPANWTCWSKLMEIASNPAWGLVFDPNNGVAFVVNLIPKGQSRSGYNTYSVMPEPNRVQVMDLLNSLPTGVAALDGLEDVEMDVKTPEEMAQLLSEMNFPPPGGFPPGGGVTVSPAAVAVAAPAPAAVGAGPHYDPGPGFVETVPEAERPAGAPRCFGNYNPKVHRCPPCPVMSPCQMKLLGIAAA